jgi:HTH-type transcriptional regulator / antitoxin HipB
MKTQQIKSFSLSEMKDKHLGKLGSPTRDAFEYELNMELLGRMIKKARQERKLTQEQLGLLVGVQKAQISKLENSVNSATVDTIIRIFQALKAEISFSVTLEGETLSMV